MAQLNSTLRATGKMRDYQALADAGFIEVVASSALAERQQAASLALASRAPAGSQDGEGEPPFSKKVGGSPDRSEERGAAPPTPPNGAAALDKGKLEVLVAFARRDWDQYPDLNILLDELTDRGADKAWAIRFLKAEREARQKAAA